MGETPPDASMLAAFNLNCNIMDSTTQASKTNSVAVVVLAVTLFLLSGAPVIAGEGVPEPPGYRMDDYRAPVPETVAGATTVSTQQLKAMIDAGGVVLVDVLPAPRKPPNMLPGVPWMPVPTTIFRAASGCPRWGAAKSRCL